MRLSSIGPRCLTGLSAGILTLGLLGPSVAFAQSAEDVQKQIELLQRQLQEVQQQLEQLKQQQQKTGEQVRQAVEQPRLPAGVAKSGNKRVQLTVSGQINRAVLFTDDGDRQDAFFVDNDNSSTRVRLVGKARATEELTVGTLFEVEFQSNPSNVVNQDNERGVGTGTFNERHFDLFFDHERFGKLSLGQGDTASNSASEVDLSGTSVVGYSSVSDMAGGIFFVDDNTGRTAIRVSDAFSNMDGLSRDDRIRYDTPGFAGFVASASAIADERWDVALRYSRQYGETKVAAAVAYSDAPGAQERIDGSISVLFGNGFNITAAAGRDDPDQAGRDNPTFVYGKLGYLMDMFEIGRTALAVDVYAGKDIGADGDDSLSVGAFAVQNVDVIATELYLGYRYYDLDRDGLDLDPVNAVMTGARIKF